MALNENSSVSDCCRCIGMHFNAKASSHRAVKTSRLPHFPENRLTDGGDVSLTRWQPSTPKNIPGTHFC
jgi:hypothetical protein